MNPLRGNLVHRPPSDPDQVGRLYFAWDSFELFRDNGNGWDKILFAHGDLTGRASDDHAQYLLATGARAGASAGVQEFTTGGRMGSAPNYADFAADGEMTRAGTARTLNAIWLGAEGLKAPGVKPATFVDHGITGVWEFTDGTDDTVIAHMRAPLRMDRLVAPTIVVCWSSPVADPGDDSKQATWDVEYLWMAVDEDTTVAAQATVPVTASASTVANGMVISSVTLAVPSAIDHCVGFRIKRRGDTDSLGGVAHLMGLRMKFTSDKLGTAT